jgi:hypothetical protein
VHFWFFNMDGRKRFAFNGIERFLSDKNALLSVNPCRKGLGSVSIEMPTMVSAFRLMLWWG